MNGNVIKMWKHRIKIHGQDLVKIKWNKSNRETSIYQITNYTEARTVYVIYTRLKEVSAHNRNCLSITQRLSRRVHTRSLAAPVHSVVRFLGTRLHFFLFFFLFSRHSHQPADFNCHVMIRRAAIASPPLSRFLLSVDLKIFIEGVACNANAGWQRGCS